MSYNCDPYACSCTIRNSFLKLFDSFTTTARPTTMRRNRHRFYSSSHNIIRAKHEEHASISCFWSCGIWCPRENHIRWTLIISVSPSSTHPFLTNVSGCFVVQKMGVSPSKFTSMAKWLFGASRWTTWPSNMSKKSCHAMICGDHRQSFKKIISAFSAPTQAKLEVAGLVNVL